MVIRDQDVRLDGLYHLLDDAVHVLMVLAGKDVQPQQLPAAVIDHDLYLDTLPFDLHERAIRPDHRAFSAPFHMRLLLAARHFPRCLHIVVHRRLSYPAPQSIHEILNRPIAQPQHVQQHRHRAQPLALLGAFAYAARIHPEAPPASDARITIAQHLCILHVSQRLAFPFDAMPAIRLPSAPVRARRRHLVRVRLDLWKADL